MNQDEARLLQAIFDDPENDTPRLIYADWLEENGDTGRAEFIRVECDVASLQDLEISPERDALAKRRAYLFRKLKQGWVPRGKKPCKFSMHRGFIKLETDPAKFLKSDAKKWWQEHARSVGWITLTAKRFSPGTAAQLPKSLVERVYEVSRGGQTVCKEGEFQEISRYSKLRGMRLRHGGINTKEALGGLLSFEKLVRLHFIGPTLRQGDIESLSSLLNLQELKFRLGGLGRESVAGLRKLTQLDKLELEEVERDGFDELPGLGTLEKLRAVALSGTWSASSLIDFELPSWPKLRTLSISLPHQLRWSKPGLRCLRQYPLLDTLQLTSDATLEIFQELPAMPQLRHLRLRTNDWNATFTIEMVKVLLKKFPNLEEFCIPCIQREPDICQEIANWTNLRKLSGLEINNLAARHWKALASLPDLEIFEPTSGMLRDLKVLSRLAKFPSLKKVRLRTPPSEELTALLAAKPGLIISQ